VVVAPAWVAMDLDWEEDNSVEFLAVKRERVLRHHHYHLDKVQQVVWVDSEVGQEVHKEVDKEADMAATTRVAIMEATDSISQICD
jgi:hypothetical protein